jgi:hypothetical protein
MNAIRCYPFFHVEVKAPTAVVRNSFSILCGTTTCSPIKPTWSREQGELQADFLLALLFDFQYGRKMFFRQVTWILTDYTVLHSRGHKSTSYSFLFQRRYYVVISCNLYILNKGVAYCSETLIPMCHTHCHVTDAASLLFLCTKNNKIKEMVLKDKIPFKSDILGFYEITSRVTGNYTKDLSLYANN